MHFEYHGLLYLCMAMSYSEFSRIEDQWFVAERQDLAPTDEVLGYVYFTFHSGQYHGHRGSS
jgi:hypothetical protein